MQGTILGFDTAMGSGVIAGADGRRYGFVAGEWKGGAALPGPGTTVDFAVTDGETVAGVYPLAPAFGYPGHAHAGAAPDKSHVAAGLLALFLGAWGIHKFYLGYNSEGAILIGATIGSLILCLILIGFLGLMVIGTITFVEAIIYLTKSEAEFQQLYVVNKRPWF